MMEGYYGVNPPRLLIQVYNILGIHPEKMCLEIGGYLMATDYKHLPQMKHDLPISPERYSLIIIKISSP